MFQTCIYLNLVPVRCAEGADGNILGYVSPLPLISLPHSDTSFFMMVNSLPLIGVYILARLDARLHFAKKTAGNTFSIWTRRHHRYSAELKAIFFSLSHQQIPQLSICAGSWLCPEMLPHSPVKHRKHYHFKYSPLLHRTLLIYSIYQLPTKQDKSVSLCINGGVKAWLDHQSALTFQADFVPGGWQNCAVTLYVEPV